MIPILLLLLTGCDAEYTVELDGDTFKADTVFSEQRSIYLDATKEQKGVDQIADFLYLIEKGRSNLTREFKQKEDQIYYYYSDHFATGEIEFWPTYATLCYENIESFPNDDGTLYIRTSKDFLCYKKYPYLNSVKIHFKTQNKVLYNNADEVKDNVYTWIITKENQFDRPLSIIVDYKQGSKTTTEKSTTSAPILSWIISLIGLGIMGFIIYILVKKIRKSNGFE